jgi:hypothetical protein
MNLKFALMQALMAFVVIFVVTHFLLGRSIDLGLTYASVAGLVMGPLMGYLSRSVTERVAGATPKQAADAAVAILGGMQTPNLDGSITVQTGFNHFWLELRAEPVKDGVILRGSGNHIRFVKAKLTAS